MAQKLTYTHPHFPKGYEFYLMGLGILKNGEAVEVTEDQERSFLHTHGLALKEALQGNDNFKPEGTASLSSKEVNDHKAVLESVSDTAAFADDGPPVVEPTPVEPTVPEGGES